MGFKLPTSAKHSGKRVREKIDTATDSAVHGVSSLISHVGSGRLGIVLALFLAVACVFLLRLIYLQVVVADTYSAMAEESRTISFTTTPKRGTIYDRNGLVLATSVDATTIYANPSEITDVDGTAYKLAEALGGEKQDYIDLIKRKKRTFVYIKRQVDNEVADKVKALDLDGVYFIEDTKRAYPNGAVGGQVIGFCNIDGEGITGLELQYNDVLQGTPGTYVAEHGRDGMPIPGGVHEETPAVDGQDIVISLDIKLQEVMEDALKKGLARLDGEKGTSIVMDGATGEIYAACSVPLMDPTNMAESEVGSDQITGITQAIEPGSVFKTVTCLAALEEGVVEPTTVIHCPSVIPADEYEISDAHKRPDVDWSVRTIMTKSSNVGISLIADRLQFDKLYAALINYGFAERTGVDYPGESAGIVHDFDNWARIVGYNVSFGQGITVTPLQMTRFYAALANDGVAVQPHFLLSMPQSHYKPLYSCERVCFDTDAMDKMKDILHTVVTDGTGTAADIDGYTVVGKTSTAEIADGLGGYLENKYNLAFAGFIDNSSSKLVCYVGANEINYEGSVTDVFKAIMSNAIEQYNIVNIAD